MKVVDGIRYLDDVVDIALKFEIHLNFAAICKA